MAVLLIGLAYFLAGVVVTLAFKGININITHKHEQPKQTEKQTYNESLVDLLPNNVKEYYHSNNGRNNF